MNKFLPLFFLAFLLYGCMIGSDSKDEKPVVKPIPEYTESLEDIFKRTGCKPLDYQNIEKMKLLVDQQNGYRYLYGSKNKEEKEVFWVAKFELSGEQIWEKTIADPVYTTTYATLLYVLPGDKVLANLVKENSGGPVILSAETGSHRLVDVPGGYFFDEVYAFENFFFCCISRKELQKNPAANEMNLQITYDGRIIYQSSKITLPYSQAFWKNTKDYLSIDEKRIVRGNILYEDDIWRFSPQLPEFTGMEINASFEKDTVIVTYHLTLPDANTEVVVYKLDYELGTLMDGSGKTPDTFLEFGKEYIAPDGMTVTVHGIDVQDNGMGTTYYTISYTLKNNTPSTTILEGTFEMFYNMTSEGESQYGFFDNLYPGESKSRSYTFKSLSNLPFSFVHYKYKWGVNSAELLKDSPKWKVPDIK